MSAGQRLGRGGVWISATYYECLISTPTIYDNRTAYNCRGDHLDLTPTIRSGADISDPIYASVCVHVCFVYEGERAPVHVAVGGCVCLVCVFVEVACLLFKVIISHV